jgi:hypothetical protein
LKEEYMRKLRLILNTELSAKKYNASNWIIGSTSITIYTVFGIINWYQDEIQKLDRKTRKIVTIHGQHHPKPDIDRLSIMFPEKM